MLSLYSELTLLTLVICSIYAIVGAYLVDLLLGQRAFGHIVNYSICLIGAYLGNVIVAWLPLDFGHEAFRAVVGATLGMSVAYLNVLVFKR